MYLTPAKIQHRLTHPHTRPPIQLLQRKKFQQQQLLQQNNYPSQNTTILGIIGPMFVNHHKCIQVNDSKTKTPQACQQSCNQENSQSQFGIQVFQESAQPKRQHSGIYWHGPSTMSKVWQPLLLTQQLNKILRTQTQAKLH